MPLTAESALRKDRTNSLSSMEHRHFATVAAILADLKPSQRISLSGTSWRYVCLFFADRLARTNPRFDRKRFLTVCGMSE